RANYKVQQESRNQEKLNPQQIDDVKQLSKDNTATQKALHEVSQEAANSPALQQIAEKAQEIADQEMHRAGDELREVAEKAQEMKANARDADFRKTDQELASAIKRVDELRHENDKVAKQRMDQAKLETAAQREKDLAERT